MKKVSIWLLLTIVIASFPMEVQARVIGNITTQITADETTYETKYPLGQTVFSDDLSETTVIVSGGSPYRVQTYQNFKINLRPSTLHGREWVKNMARISMVQSRIPEAVMNADGIMGWHIRRISTSELKAELYIGLKDGREVTMIQYFYHSKNGWYNVLEMENGTVRPESVIDWVGAVQ
ncbi:hypothetical protein IJ096_02440 [Candidatus Saccharibacteria bacterium]|nr:hypothetical protein [Candidatus Saccharibacteria bacterium]